MGGGGDRMPFETLHSKDIKMPHVYHISSQTGGTHYKKRFQTLQPLLYLCIHRTLTLGIFLCTRPPSVPVPLSPLLPLPLPGPLYLSLSLFLSPGPSPSPCVRASEALVSALLVSSISRYEHMECAGV